MFDRLKYRVALRQGTMLAILLVVLIGLLFGHGVVTLLSQLRQKRAELRSDPERCFSTEVEIDRDTLFIKITDGEIVGYTDVTFYDQATLNEVVSYALAHTEGRGKYDFAGHRTIYEVTEQGTNLYIGLYDYTKDYSAMKRNSVLFVIIAAVGFVAVGFFAINSAKRQIAPIEEAFEKQKELIANASHELKTPLTVISANLDILQTYRGEMSDEVKKWIDGVSDQVNRMKSMVEEMLELAKMESEYKKDVFCPVDLSEVVEGVVLGTEVLAFERSIEMKTEIEKSLFVDGVSQKLEKLVYILVENAFKYTPHGGYVEVALKQEKRHVVFSVKNSGEGIEKEDIPKLFDRFYRTDESHHTANGFGLGLAIAKSIVDAHEASIDVESVVGEYTLFSVTFAKNPKGRG